MMFLNTPLTASTCGCGEYDLRNFCLMLFCFKNSLNEPLNSSPLSLITEPIFSCEAGHKKVSEILIENGADLNLADFLGRPALHYACSKFLPVGDDFHDIGRVTAALDFLKYLFPTIQ